MLLQRIAKSRAAEERRYNSDSNLDCHAFPDFMQLYSAYQTLIKFIFYLKHYDLIEAVSSVISLSKIFRYVQQFTGKWEPAIRE